MPVYQVAVSPALVEDSLLSLGWRGLADLLNLTILDDIDSRHYNLPQPVGVNEFRTVLVGGSVTSNHVCRIIIYHGRVDVGHIE